MCAAIAGPALGNAGERTKAMISAAFS